MEYDWIHGTMKQNNENKSINLIEITGKMGKIKIRKVNNHQKSTCTFPFLFFFSFPHTSESSFTLILLPYKTMYLTTDHLTHPFTIHPYQ